MRYLLPSVPEDTLAFRDTLAANLTHWEEQFSLERVEKARAFFAGFDFPASSEFCTSSFEDTNEPMGKRMTIHDKQEQAAQRAAEIPIRVDEQTSKVIVIAAEVTEPNPNSVVSSEPTPLGDEGRHTVWALRSVVRTSVLMLSQQKEVATRKRSSDVDKGKGTSDGNAEKRSSVTSLGPRMLSPTWSLYVMTLLPRLYFFPRSCVLVIVCLLLTL